MKTHPALNPWAPRREAQQVTGTPVDAQFSCEACGANLKFSPRNQRLLCDHCGHTNVVAGDHDGSHLDERDYLTVLERLRRQQAQGIEVTVADCPNCGASFEFDPKERAGLCPFCDAAMVKHQAEHQPIQPQGVLPFAISEKQAREALNKWVGRLWFAPNDLRQYMRAGRKMNGIYIPYWTYDANTISHYVGARGDVYYVTERAQVPDGNGGYRVEARQVPRIRWTPVRGTVRRFFDDVLVSASKTLPTKHQAAIDDWDLHGLMPFHAGYLAGFRAECYQVPLDEGFQHAKETMDHVIRRDIRFDIGGDQQRIDGVQTTYQNVTFKHILLPIWTAAYRYGGKSYQFLVNGRTGAVAGERPYSAWKLGIAIALMLVAAVAFGMWLIESGTLARLMHEMSSGGQRYW